MQRATLNQLGYKYLYWRHVESALGIFRLNVELHHESAKTHDSLGGAYLPKDDTKLAIMNYRRSLELDPANENAKTMLLRLEDK